MTDVKAELETYVIAKVKDDSGFSGKTIVFNPSCTLLGDVQKCYVQIGSEHTILSDPDVRDFRTRVALLESNAVHLQIELNDLKENL